MSTSDDDLVELLRTEAEWRRAMAKESKAPCDARPHEAKALWLLQAAAVIEANGLKPTVRMCGLKAMSPETQRYVSAVVQQILKSPDATVSIDRAVRHAPTTAEATVETYEATGVVTVTIRGTYELP